MIRVPAALPKDWSLIPRREIGRLTGGKLNSKDLMTFSGFYRQLRICHTHKLNYTSLSSLRSWHFITATKRQLIQITISSISKTVRKQLGHCWICGQSRIWILNTETHIEHKYWEKEVKTNGDWNIFWYQNVWYLKWQCLLKVEISFWQVYADNIVQIKLLLESGWKNN